MCSSRPRWHPLIRPTTSRCGGTCNASSPRNSSATPNTTANGIDPIDYDTEEPFVSFERARQSGDFRVFACATVLEPLTLWAELLTVAVIAAPVFDKLLSGMVAIDDSETRCGDGGDHFP